MLFYLGLPRNWHQNGTKRHTMTQFLGAVSRQRRVESLAPDAPVGIEASGTTTLAWLDMFAEILMWMLLWERKTTLALVEQPFVR